MTRRTAAGDDPTAVNRLQGVRQSPAVPAMAPGPIGESAGLPANILQDDRRAGSACDTGSSRHPGSAGKAMRCSLAPSVPATTAEQANTKSVRSAQN
jgi:hypothetical protein